MRLEGTSEIQAMGKRAEAHIPLYLKERKMSAFSLLPETFQTEKHESIGHILLPFLNTVRIINKRA